MSGFIGFPDVKMRPVVIPDHFFTELLTQIDDLAELKLTLHCFWLLNEQSGEVKYLRGADLRADAILLRSLSLNSDLRAPEATLEDALQRATARNTLLKLEVELGQNDQEDEESAQLGVQSKIENRKSKIQDWYFINTVKGRQAVALIRQGKLTDLGAVLPEEARLRVERPNIFLLYEQNIGLLTPLLADQLRDLEKSYSPEWITEAFEIAVSRNKRALRYIQSILKRWETEGKQPNKEGGSHAKAEYRTAEQRKRAYLPDEFSDVILG